MASDPVNVNEFQELARQALPKMYYDFFAGAAEDEHTLRENVKAFSQIIIRPRILIDVSHIDMSTSVLGHHISSPIMIAPTSYHKLLHPEDIYTQDLQVTSILGALFQFYVQLGGGCRLLQCCTVLSIICKMIAPQLKNLEGFMSTEVVTDKGSGPEAFVNSIFDSSLSWKDIDWLRSITKLPILVKGLLTHEDAIKAVEVGVDGIVVSNHGARQLDYAPATISVLEEVVHAVGNKVPVLFDGGVRRGTDVFKALALGAQAVLVGRPVIFGLAAKGENGVKSVIKMLQDELELTMALAGCPRIKDITRNRVRTGHEKPQSML